MSTAAPTSTNSSISAAIHTLSARKERSFASSAALFCFSAHAMLITASRPESGTRPFSAVSSAGSRNERLKRISSCAVPRTFTLRKNSASSSPAAAPSAIPSTMDSGMPMKSAARACPPCAMLVKIENSTITNTSSQDAPARIICGMLLSVPRRSSMSLTMRGTTTAGETALSTAPVTAASTGLIPSSFGASST